MRYFYDMEKLNKLLKRCSVALFLILLISSLLAAQMITGRLGTSVYTFEKFDTVGISKVISRGIQTFQFSVTESDVSIQTSLYGASNLSHSFGNDAVFRVNNLFMRWRNIGSTGDVSVGRIPVFAGVGNGVLDGVHFKLRFIENQITATGYGGTNVHPDLRSAGFDNLGNNFFLGGQLLGAFVQNFRISLSYMNKRIQRDGYSATRFDTLLNPISTLVLFDSRAEQLFGVDARYSDNQLFSLYGRYDHDINMKRILRFQASGRVEVSQEFAFTADYLYRQPRIYANSWFTVFPVSSINEIEGGVEYAFSEFLKGFGKFAYVQYTDASTNRFTLGVTSEHGNLSYAGITGYAGVLHSLSAQCMYPLLDRKLIPTVGLSYASYKFTEEEQQENTFAGSLGAIARPDQSFSVNMQAQWLKNKTLKNDIRLLVKLDYWFNYNLNLFAGGNE